ncbi:MAG: putative ABC transporter permease [Clostridiales bacterium]|nr:putative ABC transporter permease [Clostridiales bacterium]
MIKLDVIWSIFFYSVAGFGLEVAFAWATGSDKKDRKCMLVLPMCPVYGLGAAAILALPPFVRERVWLLLPAAALVATAAEYLMSLFYEKVWRVSFWDYSGLPGSIHGRVCLPFSVAWSLLSLPLVFWLQPLVAGLVAALPDLLLVPLGMVFAVDFALTGYVLRQTENTDSLKWYC